VRDLEKAKKKKKPQQSVATQIKFHTILSATNGIKQENLFKKIKQNVHLIRLFYTRAYEGETHTVNSLYFPLSTHSYTHTILAANNLGHNNITLPASPSSSEREFSPKTQRNSADSQHTRTQPTPLVQIEDRERERDLFHCEFFDRIQSGGYKFELIFKQLLVLEFFQTDHKSEQSSRKLNETASDWSIESK